MDDTREQFRRWTDCLLDPASSAGEQRAAAHAWCSWGLAALGIDDLGNSAPCESFFTRTRLPTGLAITPVGAARCVREHLRTAVFLQGMAAALRTARERFPGETIHVLEAGCGPLAALSLPFALRYAPEEVCFTLLDLHPVSLDAACRLAESLGLRRSIRACVAADATAVQLAAAERPHVIACEVLLRALTREPQVAATLNLAPQLRPGGIFVPERIDVDAALFDHGAWLRGMAADTTETGRATVELGNVFTLSASRDGAGPRETPDRLAAATIVVPPHPLRTPFHLFTRIQVFGAHRLGDFDCSLNLPERVSLPLALAEQGGTADFHYEISAEPGLKLSRTHIRSGEDAPKRGSI